MINQDSIAIIGMGCRFPQASDPTAFWHLICNGIDAITPIPAERAYLNLSTKNSSVKNWAGLLERIEEFDAQFFGITPREVISMDPQQRLLLEVVWEALEDAALIPGKLAETRTGVFVGIPRSDYYELLMADTNHLNSSYTVTGNSSSIAANRISYIFNFTGPSLALDTACSSSLVAVHLACQSLEQGESTLALAAGVQIMLSSHTTASLAEAGMISAQGRCRTFDAQADGFVRGEGVGVVVLKRLSQAIADQNFIYGIIRGSAINQDGRTNGLSAPNLKAQEALLRQAYQNAGISPSSVQYVEAQGTGTLLGDAIELEALAAVLGEKRTAGNVCRVGSVKTNIGHLEIASGIAGLIKVALSFKYKQIPPSLHFQQPNPYVKLDKLPLRVQQNLEPWSTEQKIIAGVSTFGFGGTNAHIVLEAGSDSITQPNQVERPIHLLTLSAKTETALQNLCHRYQEYLSESTDLTLGDICFTANTGRTQFNHRLAITASSKEQLREKMAAFTSGNKSTGSISGVVKPKQRPKIGFLFTGFIPDHVELDRQLYETQPTFRRILDYCDAITQPSLGKSLVDILYSPNIDNVPTDGVARGIALFALQVALAELWKSWGIEPDVIMGTSLGEIAAGCSAGIFSLEDGLKMIEITLSRQQMKSETTVGMMVGVFGPEDQVAAAIAPYADKIAIAFVDGVQVVISGEQEAVQIVTSDLKEKGFPILKWNTTSAYHSPLMESLDAVFDQYASKFNLHPPQIPFISGFTGQLSDNVKTIEYWQRVIREPVRLPTAMQTMYQQGVSVFIEIGPKPILLPKGIRCLPSGIGVWLPSLRLGQSSWQQLLFSLSQLYILGAPVNWLGFDQDYARHYVQIPTYPFERQRYWVETDCPQAPVLHRSVISTLLELGNTEEVIQLLAQTEQFSPEQWKILPQLLAALVQQHHLTALPAKEKGSSSLNRSVLEVPSSQPKSFLTRSDLSTSLEEQTQQLESYLTEQLTLITGFNQSQLDKQQPMNTLGLDSLMAFQLIDRVRTDLDLELPLEELFEGITITELSIRLRKLLAQENLVQGIKVENSEQMEQEDLENSERVTGEI